MAYRDRIKCGQQWLQPLWMWHNYNYSFLVALIHYSCPIVFDAVQSLFCSVPHCSDHYFPRSQWIFGLLAQCAGAIYWRLLVSGSGAGKDGRRASQWWVEEEKGQHLQLVFGAHSGSPNSLMTALRENAWLCRPHHSGDVLSQLAWGQKLPRSKETCHMNSADDGFIGSQRSPLQTTSQ